MILIESFANKYRRSVSLMMKANVDTAIISQALGHRSIKTTRVYLLRFENSVIDNANEKVFDNLRN